MATIHDVMPAFELFQPASIEDALSLLERHRRSVWVLAGGLDTFDWLKDRNKRPQVVIDLSGIEALRGIKTTPDGGLEIGATTTLTEIANHAVVKEKFKLCRLGRARGVAQIPTRHARWEHLAGYALLVLSQRVDVLSSRGQHLLRRHATSINREHPCSCEPLRRRESLHTAPRWSRSTRRGGSHSSGERVISLQSQFFIDRLSITPGYEWSR